MLVSRAFYKITWSTTTFIPNRWYDCRYFRKIVNFISVHNLPYRMYLDFPNKQFVLNVLLIDLALCVVKSPTIFVPRRLPRSFVSYFLDTFPSSDLNLEIRKTHTRMWSILANSFDLFLSQQWISSIGKVCRIFIWYWLSYPTCSASIIGRSAMTARKSRLLWVFFLIKKVQPFP